ncbi:MAG: hypothetical protein ACSLE9_06225 [Burkholderiaceae bacterium]
MTTRPHPIVATLTALLAVAFPWNAVHAQASAPPTLPAAPPTMAPASASAGKAAPGGPRLRTPAETAARAAAPGDLRPERPVVPQVSIPLGKKTPPTTKRETRAMRNGTAAASGGVHDAAARCEALADAEERVSCRAGLAKDARGKQPK